MKVKELRKQVAAVLGTDLLEEAKIVWVYLAVCRSGGVGVATLALRLAMDEEVVSDAIEVLKEAGIAQRRRGVYKAIPYLREEERASDAPVALRDAAKGVLEVYQECRTRAGARRLIVTRGHMRDFERLAEWLNANSVDAREFITWGGERANFLKDKGVAFPAPNLLAGEWLHGEWLNGERVAKSNGHAGKTYGDVAGLRRRLVAAGFDRARGYSKSDIRDIESWATDMAALPDDFTDDSAPEEFRREILWLRDHLTGDGDVPPP